MSIASEITRIQNAKTDIKTAIENKGVTVPSASTLDDYADFGGKKIYVPAASLAAYQEATNWSTYASYMVGE